MRLYPLSLLAGEAAHFLADIHLRPSVKSIAKILSDAAHFSMNGKVPQKVLDNGITEYWMDGAHLYPPSKDVNVWSKWAAMNYYNYWWLVDYAFQITEEYLHRFKSPTIDEYLRIQSWTMQGLPKLFPKKTLLKKDSNGIPSNFVTIDEWPVVLPNDELVKLGISAGMSVVDIYRAFYVAQKGKVRMHWSHRSPPSFMFPDLAKLTQDCSSLTSRDIPF